MSNTLTDNQRERVGKITKIVDLKFYDILWEYVESHYYDHTGELHDLLVSLQYENVEVIPDIRIRSYHNQTEETLV